MYGKLLCLSDHFSPQISELEALNFSLEEQLMEVQEGERDEMDGGERENEGRRGRSATLIEAALQDRDQVSMYRCLPVNGCVDEWLMFGVRGTCLMVCTVY